MGSARYVRHGLAPLWHFLLEKPLTVACDSEPVRVTWMKERGKQERSSQLSSRSLARAAAAMAAAAWVALCRRVGALALLTVGERVHGDRFAAAFAGLGRAELNGGVRPLLVQRRGHLA